MGPQNFSSRNGSRDRAFTWVYVFVVDLGRRQSETGRFFKSYVQFTLRNLGKPWRIDVVHNASIVTRDYE